MSRDPAFSPSGDRAADATSREQHGELTALIRTEKEEKQAPRPVRGIAQSSDHFPSHRKAEPIAIAEVMAGLQELADPLSWHSSPRAACMDEYQDPISKAHYRSRVSQCRTCARQVHHVRRSRRRVGTGARRPDIANPTTEDRMQERNEIPRNEACQRVRQG